MLIDQDTKFTFNSNLEGYAQLMALIFEDEHYSSEQLTPAIYTGIQKGITKYSENDRQDDPFAYITFFVKREVIKFKKTN
jgi:hypothetical protein